MVVAVVVVVVIAVGVIVGAVVRISSTSSISGHHTFARDSWR